MQDSNTQAYDIPLHDIKPLIEIQEYSFYYLLGVIGLSVLVVFTIAYLLYIWYKKRQRFNIRKHHKELIDTLEFSDSKNTAYLLTQYALTFKNDSLEHTKSFEQLAKKLEDYKYKKNVDAFDAVTLQCIEEYKSLLHV